MKWFIPIKISVVLQSSCRIFVTMNEAINREFTVLGLMSGTSLDGLDLALCKFISEGAIWQGEIIRAETQAYPAPLRNSLLRAMELSGEELVFLDNELGILIGERCKFFLQNADVHPLCIASHGHTIFHQPAKQLTFQIGNPAALAVKSGCKTVADFRRTDVALGGQGAPLVPFGDIHLFSDYEYCLNLGGIANITAKKGEKIEAFDVCPANMILNQLISEIGKEYDENGLYASTGILIPDLFEKLNSLDYYHEKGPKSLGREWFENTFLPIVESSDASLADRLNTCVEHIAFQIAAKTTNSKGSMLITGGGAFNSYLIQRIRFYVSVKIVVPEETMIQFKEAYVFAFLGLMRYLEIDNTWSTITGASRSSCGGAIYLP
jgi:anhydro-N-acetylmuramic acid kinase